VLHTDEGHVTGVERLWVVHVTGARDAPAPWHYPRR
jgi:hypothetical protein